MRLSAHPALARLLPFLRWGRSVNRSTVKADLIAGLVGAVIVLPQGLAFAALAGLPPEYGLYAAMVPTAIAALFGSSLHAVSGPTNAVSLMVFAALSPLATPGSEHYVQLALTLAFMSGVMMIAMGAFGLGSLVNFVSSTVIIGFTAAIGVLIFASQLQYVLGLDLPQTAGFLDLLGGTFRHITQTKPWVVAIAAITIGAGVMSKRWLPRMPSMFVAMIAGSLAGAGLNHLLGAAHTGVRSIGPLSGALPPLSWPDLSPQQLQSLLGAAVAVSLVSLTQTISIARAISLRSGQRLDNNQEFIGQGLANLAGSFFSSFPTSASVNRCGINFEAGARTPLAAVFSAVLLAIILLAIAPLAAYLPLPAVGGLLFLAAWGLIDSDRIGAIVRTSRAEALVLAVTFFATLLLDVEIAILVGVMASLSLYLNRTSHPQMRSLVPDPRHAGRKMTEIEDGLRECPQAKILRIEGSIYFGAVNHVGNHFDTLRAHSPGQKHLLLMAKSINFVDIAGAELLVSEARRRREEGGRLYFYSLRRPVDALLARGGYLREIGRENIFRGKREAFAGVIAHLDRGICANCTARIFEECRHLPGAARVTS